MSEDLYTIFILATKLEDISDKIPFDKSLAFFLDQLDCESHICKEILPITLSE